MYIYTRAYIYICIYVIASSSESLIRVHKTQHVQTKGIVFRGRKSARGALPWFPRILDTTFINYTLSVIGTQARIVKISNIRYTCDLKLLYIL